MDHSNVSKWHYECSYNSDSTGWVVEMSQSDISTRWAIDISYSKIMEPLVVVIVPVLRENSSTGLDWKQQYRSWGKTAVPVLRENSSTGLDWKQQNSMESFRSCRLNYLKVTLNAIPYFHIFCRVKEVTEVSILHLESGRLDTFRRHMRKGMICN